MLAAALKLSLLAGGWIWGELYKVFGHYIEMEGVIGEQMMLFLIKILHLAT